MKKVLENTTLFGNPAAGTVGLVKREEVLADLAKVSHSERIDMLLVGKRGSAGGLASLAEDQLKGALGELMVGSAYGNNVKRFRMGLNGNEFDIELLDGTLVEVSWKTTPKIEGIKSKLEIMKHKGKTKIVFAFGPEAPGSGKGFIEWKSKVISEAQSKGITVEFKKVIINPDGSKGLIDL
ncbi:MAG: hypothetical protein RMK94_14385 [Armatimonadota bacterium]|nr:hypothetical protein [Armatimonadota bacterium]